MRGYILFTAVLCSMLNPGLVTTHALGTTIYYVPSDLADVAPGEDLWRYQYFVHDFAFSENQGFTVYFDRNIYRALQSPPPSAGSDWDVITLQPDLNLPDDGAYDALALVDNPSLPGSFLVDFVYLGAGTPGSQPFDVNQFAPDGSFDGVLDSGFTLSIPEPATGLLSLSALGALLYRAVAKRTN